MSFRYKFGLREIKNSTETNRQESEKRNRVKSKRMQTGNNEIWEDESKCVHLHFGVFWHHKQRSIN